MKATFGILLLLILLSPTALLIPGRATLDLYDVQDISYSMTDMPGVDISLAESPPGWFAINYWVLDDLADEMRWLVPGSSSGRGSRSVDGQNGLLIVRATSLQHFAVRLRLATARARIRVLEGVNAAASGRPLLR